MNAKIAVKAAVKTARLVLKKPIIRRFVAATPVRVLLHVLRHSWSHLSSHLSLHLLVALRPFSFMQHYKYAITGLDWRCFSSHRWAFRSSIKQLRNMN